MGSEMCIRDRIQRWDRGLEILPGAQLAVEAINRDPELLPGHDLEIVPVNVDPCIPLEVHSNLNAFVPFAKGIPENTVGMLGLFCERLLRILSPLAGRDEFGLFQLSGTTSPQVRQNREKFSHLNFAVPSEAAYYETVFVLMSELGWRRVLVIDEEFFHIGSIRNATLLTKNLDISFMEFSDVIFTMINEIRQSEKNIVLVSVGARRTADLLCAAYDDGLVWPHYVWILQDHETSDLLTYAHKDCTAKKLVKALQHIILLNFQDKQTDTLKELVSGSTYEAYSQQYMNILNKSGGILKHNKFANTLHDSVWAFALALNNSVVTIARDNMTVIDFVKKFGRKELTKIIESNLLSVSFEGVSGHVQFNINNDIEALVHITLVECNGTTIDIGFYDQRLPGTLSINKMLLPADSLQDQLPSRHNLIPLPVAVLLTTVVILCLLLTTFMFILFIRYRRYSEVKATSPYLSLLMFAGSYFILISTFTQAILTAVESPTGTAASAALCGSVISGNAMGVNLIFSTLLLRMLRIYHIFSYFGKTGKIWSDKVLAVIVLIIVGGDIVLLLIWFLVDPFTVKNVTIYKPDGTPPYYEISQYCCSENIGVWFSLMFGKVGILFAIVLFLAIKTRKIQRENFKDTKKVNIYIFLTVMIIATLIPVWFLLEGTGNVIGTGIVIYVAFGATGLFCQIMHFAPKVLPPLLRSMGFKVGLSPGSRHKKTIRKSGKYNARQYSHKWSSTWACSSPSISHNLTSSTSSSPPTDPRKLSTVTILTSLESDTES